MDHVVWPHTGASPFLLLTFCLTRIGCTSRTRRFRQGCWPAGLLLLISSLSVYATDADKEQELKRIYKELIDDENRHDLVAVRKLVWDSPSILLVAKAPVGWHGYWGLDDMIRHLHDMYQTPFRIDPKYDEKKVVFITGDIAETYAPVRITVAYAGHNPVPSRS